MIDKIEWLGYASIRYQGPPLIYINPWRIARNAFLADLILISHQEYTHCSPADVRKLCGPNTVIVSNATAKTMLPDDRVQVLRPWQSVNVGRARVSAIPAYTPHRRTPSGETGLGYLISVDYHDIYYAGETGLTPEMARLRPDLAILPVGLPNVMSVDEAVEAVKLLRPRWVLPSHWNAAEGGTYLDVRNFEDAVGDLATVLVPAQTR